MAKESGLGDNFYVDGYDLSGDSNTIAITNPLAVQDVTGMNKSAMERLGLLHDGQMNWNAFWNTAAASAHAVLSTRPTDDRIVTYCRGTTLGSHAASLNAKQVDYNPTRGTDGAISSIAVQALANGYGTEWGQLLTAGKRADTGATNGTGVDLIASTAFGLQAYLHVFSFTGTSCTVKIQESSDNGVGDAWADVVGGGFTAATGITKQRIETARGLTVERYLRAVTTGTFSECTFALMVVKNLTSVVFTS